MEELALKNIVTSQLKDAAGYCGGDLSDERSKAMDYYLGEPYGDEMEGRSQVVSRDVMETVEWMKPALLDTFTSTSEIIRFDPQGPEDEAAAEQETEYVNFVFWNDSDGFLVLNTWFTDALLQKNGIVKAYVDDAERYTKEEYRGLDDDEFLMLMQDDDLDLTAHTEEIDEELGVTLHDATFKRKHDEKRIRVVPVPPEEFKVSRRHNSVVLDECDFCAHTVERTASDLIAEGYDAELIKSIPTYDDTRSSEEEIARYNLTDEQTVDNRTDDAMRLIRVHECYLRVDYDGDGIAELRKVTLAGNEILDNEEVAFIPFAAITPYILSHKFFGLSVADTVMDLQRIRSTLWRQTLDNLYLSNNPEKEVVEDQVNLDDLLVSRPGGIKRVKQAGMIRELATPFVAGSSFQMFEYLDTVTEKRTGVGPNFMGQQYEVGTDTAHGLERLMTAAESKVRLIARIFAEVGIKPLFRKIHAMLQMHQDKERVIKLRNQWVPIDPRGWRERTDMTVRVGLGTGERQRMQAAVGQVLAFQEKLIMAGGMNSLVTPKHVFNALDDFSKFSGLEDAEKYFLDPDSDLAKQMAQQQAQNQQQDPQTMAVQAQIQIEREKAQVQAQKNQNDAQAKMMDMQFKMQEANRSWELKVKELERKYDEMADKLRMKMTELEIGSGVDVPGSAV